MLEPEVELSPWLLLKHAFNTDTFKVRLNTKSVLYTLDWSVLRFI